MIRKICILLLALTGCKSAIQVSKWESLSIPLTTTKTFKNPYKEVEVWATFVNQKGDTIHRPAFWDGNKQWQVRFSAPHENDKWTWRVFSLPEDINFKNKTGRIKVSPYLGKNQLNLHGTLKMSPEKRNVVHADGSPFLLIGDTPWSLPYRATTDQVHEYAINRKTKGFNTALLIAVQPDIKAEGPEQRNTEQGFARGFFDLNKGHLNEINPSYFQTLDTLTQILYDHEIVPVFAPLAHGYGWKGKQSLGPNVDPDEYTRFVKYLLARYGNRPALWLLSLDGNGNAPGIIKAGEMLEKWDSYKQPTGLHYNPCDDFLATWAKEGDGHCFHLNKKHQDAPWLDFQWAQTGHDGKHLYYKVEKMYDNLPTKAVMNGEPTYEGMNEGKEGLGWWQGRNAWNELMHGGTMGVVYGAVSLWQWKITPNEAGWEEWTNANVDWREAMDFEGAKYVGFIAKAFNGFNSTDMKRKWELTGNNSPLLAKEGHFYISYLENGGKLNIRNMPENLYYYWFDPLKGSFHTAGKTVLNEGYEAPNQNQPWVFIASKTPRK